MGLLSKLSGGGNKDGDASVFVFGTDKRFCRRKMESQGAHLQDNVTRQAYFSATDAIGTLTKQSNGVTRTMGPISVAYEPVTELYAFPYLDWLPDRNKKTILGGNGHSSIWEEDEILDNGWAEGFALAHQKQGDEEARNKLMQILLLAVLGATVMFLLVAASTGILGDFASNIGKFFGG